MALLEVNQLSIHFGGVKAVQNVSFSIDAGIVYAVIGPNGAGKTTLFNLITGIYTPTSGEIKLDGESIGVKTPNELAKRGVARTFQNLQICMNMSAIENVMVGRHLHEKRNVLTHLLTLPSAKAKVVELGRARAKAGKMEGNHAVHLRIIRHIVCGEVEIRRDPASPPPFLRPRPIPTQERPLVA